MKKRIYFALCVVPTLIGTVIGWQVGENIGIAALPPNAWAGDGIGILEWNIHGASWGMSIGFGIGVVCCLMGYFLVRRRQSRLVIPESGVSEDGVWPPAPTHQP